MKSTTPRQHDVAELRNSLQRLAELVPQTMLVHRHRLRRELQRIRTRLRHHGADGGLQRKLRRLAGEVHTSVETARHRRAGVPRPVYDQNLPITARREEIVTAIRQHQVLIVSGATGSGKTTQLPKFCLEAGQGVYGRIGCTQPRRIAAVTVAARIAEELESEPGALVGHKIRFNEALEPGAYVKLMTDGILLSESQSDRFLNEYDTIIVDEAHERSLNIDFTLGILKGLLRKRKDLKLIITSATIDTQKFSQAFDRAPVIEVSGRMYPVEVRYRPPTEPREREQSFAELAAETVDDLTAEDPGDMLVFMPTEQDIRETCDILASRRYPGTTVLPLYGRLAAADQQRVFAPTVERKIVVATNVAETSITIPGIRYVVDTGVARIAQYSPATRTSSLPVAKISRSSADQRAGRCGRVQNGVCVRLYAEEDYRDRPEFTSPEILRANLAEVILRMASLGLGAPEHFPFVDAPQGRAIRDGVQMLVELEAVREEANEGRLRLTEDGTVMARLPLDPRLSRMLIQASREGCLAEVTVIAAVLSIQDPRERPAERTAEADAAHAEFADPDSDFVGFLRLWNVYQAAWRTQRRWKRMHAYCRERFLSFKRMLEWQDVHNQLRDTLAEHGFATDVEANVPARRSARARETHRFDPGYAAIHRSVLSGFLSNVASKKEGALYNATKGRLAMVFPGSGVFDSAGQWIVAAEMVKTSRLFARTVATVDVRWIEELAEPLLVRRHGEPYWNAESLSVTAEQTVSLFGLTVVPRRTVAYGPVDPTRATEVFVWDALVEEGPESEELEAEFPFLAHNRKLLRQLRRMEDKLRVRGLLVSQDEMYRFYRERFRQVSSVAELRRFLKTEGSDDFLRMRPEDAVLEAPDPEELALYPDSLCLGSRTFPLTYCFDPTADEDGVTLHIPRAAAGDVDAAPLTWLVPGLVADRVLALLRGLPKEFRRALAPVAQTAELLRGELERSGTPLTVAMAAFLRRRMGVSIPESAWNESAVPAHLRMRISVEDAEGNPLAVSRDPGVLTRIPRPTVDRGALRRLRSQLERADVGNWDCGALPEFINASASGGVRVSVLIALNREGDRVALRLYTDESKARRRHLRGVSSLYERHFAQQLRDYRAELTLPPAMRGTAQYFGGDEALCRQVWDEVAIELFSVPVRTREDFLAHAREVAPKIHDTAAKLLEQVKLVLRRYRDARDVILRLAEKQAGNAALTAFLSARRADLDALVPREFVHRYGIRWLHYVERYVSAVQVRAERGVTNLPRDREREAVLTPYLSWYHRTTAETADETGIRALEEFHLLLQEFAVSVFAQDLKTHVRISEKLLRRKMQEIEDR